MALDGIAIRSLILELKNLLLDGKIDKIHQPEKDEIILYVRSKGANHKLLLSASANDARAHLTQVHKSNPLQAPMFCMLLRKHLTNGRIVEIHQPELERVMEFHIESKNELGDLSIKKLTIEIMGKHSNIILINEENKILDSIKHVNFNVSRIREILPGKFYMNPPSQHKTNPLEVTQTNFIKILSGQSQGTKIDKALFNSFMGISLITAREICFRAKLDMDLYIAQLTEENYLTLFHSLYELLREIKTSSVQPCLVFDYNDTLIEFTPVKYSIYYAHRIKTFNTISEVIESFYRKRDIDYRLKQKSTETVKIIQTNLDRCYKKKEIQIRTLKDVEDREKYRMYGDIITANIYQLHAGQTHLNAPNFYSEDYQEVEIPLDPLLTPSENAQRYFKKYSKAKTTFVMVQEQMQLNDEEIVYLETLLNAVEHIESEEDIEEIKEELVESGYIRKRILKNKRKKSQQINPLHYISSDGFNIYVGKNNKQNDQLTLKTARTYDLWFHTKEIPGSHVIVQTDHKEVPQTTINEAGLLAAYYSKAKLSSNVPVDYTQRKNVKKPSGAKLGMVIYDNYKTLYVTPDETYIRQLKKES